MNDMLRLMAVDAEDLSVISANLQDAEVDPAALTYMPETRRFALVASRFDWVKSRDGVYERCQAGIHFEHVHGVAQVGLEARRDRPPLTLLGLLFQPTDAPGGHVVLTFTCGAAVRLAVECIEARLADIGPRWTVQGMPPTASA